MKYPCYMMATKATHLLGDISRDEPDLCYIKEETEDAYIGSWVEGFGFVDVQFDKSTTKELTEEEVKTYNGMSLSISGRHFSKVNIENNKAGEENENQNTTRTP